MFPEARVHGHLRKLSVTDAKQHLRVFAPKSQEVQPSLRPQQISKTAGCPALTSGGTIDCRHAGECNQTLRDCRWNNVKFEN